MREAAKSGSLTAMLFDAELLDDLRRAVQQFRVAERRRRFPPVLRVGSLTGWSASWTPLVGDRLDVGLRTEIVAALLDRARAGPGVLRPAVWLTRTGRPLPHDEDVAWDGPVHRALAEAEVSPLCVVVVTKTGWYSPREQQHQEWKRPRRRRPRGR